ncbi:MAG: hypothetical protein Q7U64_09945 [Desulfocapsaceae bacterium]|jgi:hypothetical protein|nr:hypothetical protein [Desulfocapsaceae bacterium]
MRKLPITDEEIEAECKRLNITQHSSCDGTGLDKAEMQRRILAALTYQRGESMWIVSLLSAIASVISAATAIIAVCLGKS